MSDQQPPNPPTDEPQISGGWRKPENVGGWRQHTPTPEEAEDTNGGWRVPAVPPELELVPTDEGAWHRPQPEDTPFTPEDEIEIAPRPENINFWSPAAEQPAAADEEESEDIGGLGELVALVSLVERRPEPSIVLRPEDSTDQPATSTAPDPAGDIEAALAAAAQTDEGEPDFSGRGSAEREALEAAAQERAPYVPLTGLRRPEDDLEEEEEEALTPEEIARRQVEALSDSQRLAAEAEQEAEALTPEEIARQQVEALSDSQQLGATEALGATGPVPVSTDDPANYARQQVQELGGEPVAEPVDPVREALAQQFLETEAQVRGLRMRYHSGQMSRDELQNELRKLLILDNNQNWWMMGVESDVWFRYDQESGDWVQDTPPRPTVSAQRTGVPTETSGLDAVDVLGNQSLPYLPDDREVTEFDAEYTPDTMGMDGMPLPRPVPINDPDLTVPGAGGIYQDTVRRSEAPTLEGMQPTVPGATIPHDFGADAGAYVPAPEVEDVSPPDYDIPGTGQTYQEAAERQRRTLLQQALLIGSILIGLMFIVGAIFVVYVVLTYNNIAAEYREQIAALADYEPPFQTARVLDSQGELIAELPSPSGFRQEARSLADVSPELIYAVIAVEDERYFENPGYDPIAIFRAFVQNLGADQVVSGASTITQQLATRLILGDDTPTADNKLREIIIASEIAQQYSKNEVLLLYLNEMFFGNQSTGVEAAAEFYFDKSADQVNLTEGAMLASLIAGPASRDPVTNRAEAFAQTDNALRQIARVPCLNFSEIPGVNREYCIDANSIINANNNFVGQTLVDRARLQTRPYQPREFDFEHPHFVYFILAQLEQEFGSDEVYRRGFVVRTTLRTEVQNAAETALQQRLEALAATRANTGAVMVSNPATGAIWAMVGSPNFNDPDIAGQINNAFAWNQPGSAIKPIEYAQALEGLDRNGNGVLDYDDYLTAASILWDVPSQYSNPPYEPVNFDGQYRGPVSVRRALANSLNIPAVKVFDFIGPNGFINISRRMGLRFIEDDRGEVPNVGRPSALGATEVRLFDMMKAYAIIANGGSYAPLYAIESITDAEGNEVALAPRPAPEGRIPAPVAFLLQNIMSDDESRAEAFGRNNATLNIPGYPGLSAVKTGTSNGNRDLWAMGFTRNVVTGVWIGRHDDADIRSTDSVASAGSVWNEVMRAGLNAAGRPRGFENPGNVEAQTICILTGTLPGASCPGGQRGELFIVDHPPPPASEGFVVTVPINSWTFLRTNDFCPNDRMDATFVDIEDPFAIPWLRAPQGQPAAQALGLPEQIIPPPQTGCTVNTVLPTAQIIGPADGQTVTGNVQVTGVVSAPNFARYQLELAPDGTNNFQLVAGPYNIQQPNAGSVLGEFNSEAAPNGNYILRLAVFGTAESGGGFVYRTTRIRVENVTPTPTITPTPTLTPTLPPTQTVIPPTPVPFITDTTVPFFPTDTPPAPIITTPINGNGSSQGGPTPTIFIGG